MRAFIIITTWAAIAIITLPAQAQNSGYCEFYPNSYCGTQGPAGPQGPKGDKGDTGNQGDVGLQGPRGDTGDSGPRGETGATGSDGERGEQGLRGNDGRAGVAGRDGSDGRAPLGSLSAVAATFSIPQGKSGIGFGLANGQNYHSIEGSIVLKKGWKDKPYGFVAGFTADDRGQSAFSMGVGWGF